MFLSQNIIYICVFFNCTTNALSVVQLKVCVVIRFSTYKIHNCYREKGFMPYKELNEAHRSKALHYITFVVSNSISDFWGCFPTRIYQPYGLFEISSRVSSNHLCKVTIGVTACSVHTYRCKFENAYWIFHGFKKIIASTRFRWNRFRPFTRTRVNLKTLTKHNLSLSWRKDKPVKITRVLFSFS